VERDGAVSVALSTDAATEGKRLCAVGLTVGPGGDATRLPEARFGGSDRLRHELLLGYRMGAFELVPHRFAGGALPSQHVERVTQARVARTGWGRWHAVLQVGDGQGFIGAWPRPFPRPAGASPGADNLQVYFETMTEADDFEFANILPSTATITFAGRLQWTTNGDLPLDVTYEHSRTRFWAEHAVDLVTLAVGALLGLLLTTRDRGGRTAGSPAPARRPRPSRVRGVAYRRRR
jgi:hypothetical protein